MSEEKKEEEVSGTISVKVIPKTTLHTTHKHKYVLP